MARTNAGRHLHRAGIVAILFSAHHLDRAFRRADRALLVFLPALALALALSSPAWASDIRVGLAEGLATVEIGGGPMLVQDLSGRALAEEPITWLRVLRRDGALEWRGQRLTGLRVSPAGGNVLRFQQRSAKQLRAIAASGPTALLTAACSSPRVDCATPNACTSVVTGANAARSANVIRRSAT